jgi:putative PEP-CTERM system TPR-repeat lipoprotein
MKLITIKWKFVAFLCCFVLASCGQQSKEELVESADKYIAQGQLQAATIALKNALVSDVKDPMLREKLGLLYFQMGNFSSAEKEFMRALELDPDLYNQITPYLFRIYVFNNQLESIKSEWLIESLNDCLECSQAYIWALNKSGEMEKAALWIKRSKSFSSKNWANNLLSVAVNGSAMAASELIETSYKQTQNTTTIEQFIIADIAFYLKKTALSQSIYTSLHVKYPDLIWINIPLAQLAMDSNNLVTAQKHIDTILKINNQQPFVNYLAAVVAIRNGKHIQAEKLAEAASANGFDKPRNNFILGMAQFKNNKFKQAWSNFQVASQAFPDNQFVSQMLMATKLKMGYGLEVAESLSQESSYTILDIPLIGQTSSILGDSQESDNTRQALKEALDSITTTNPNLNQLKEAIKLQLDDSEGTDKLKALINDHGADEISYRVLVNFMLKRGDIPGALAEIESWKNNQPDNVDSYNLEGAIYYATGDMKKAAKAYIDVKKISPHNAPSYFFEMKQLLSKRLFEEAQVKAEELLDLHPVHLRTLQIHLLINRYIGKNIKSSIELIKKSVNAQGSTMSHQLLLAGAYASNNEFTNASFVMNRLDPNRVEKVPQYWEIKYQLAMKNGSDLDRKQIYTDWKQSIPARPEAYLRYAGDLFKRRQTQRAVEALKVGLKKNNDSLAIQVSLTLYSLHLGDATGARKMLDTLKEGGRVAAVQMAYLTGYLHFVDGNLKDSLIYLKKSYTLSNANSTAFLIAQILKLENLPLIEFLESHIKNRPADFINRRMLAENYIGIDNAKAIAHFQALLEIAPEDPNLLNNYAWLLHLANKNSEAVLYSTKAVQVRSDDVELLDTHASILINLKQYSVVAKMLKNRKDKDITLLLHYSEALLGMGKSEESKIILNTIVNLAKSPEQQAKYDILKGRI